MNILIVLAIFIIVGLLATRIIRLFNLPNVTGYLIAGLLIGPSMFLLISKIFNIDLLYYDNYSDAVNKLSLLSDVALGFIALSIGVEFKLHHLKEIGKKVFIITLFQALTTTLFVDVALIALHKVLGISLGVAVTLGAIATATAPAATLLVVRQYNAKGPVVDTLLPVVALDDAVGLMVFSISFAIAKVYDTGADVTIMAVLVNPLVEIFASLLVGFGLGALMTLISKAFKSRANTLGLLIAFSLLCVGLSQIQFHFGEVEFSFSSLLVCMMLGATYANLRKDTQRYLARVDEFTPPLFLSFFVISGASIDFSVINSISIVLVALIYIVVRSLGKYSGAYVGSLITKAESDVRKYLGITLLPQAGVAIGMANMAKAAFDVHGSHNGDIIYTIVLTATLVYELVGPLLTKLALEKANEIDKNTSIIGKHRLVKHHKIKNAKLITNTNVEVQGSSDANNQQ